MEFDTVLHESDVSGHGQRPPDLQVSIDAHKDSMARSREQAIAGVTSGLISLGEEVTWRAWHFGFRCG